MCHLALEHYSGGWPVPRAQSYTSGGKQIYANILTYVGCLYPLILPIHLSSNNQIAGLISDLHPFG
jgi:hypothetical protein